MKIPKQGGDIDGKITISRVHRGKEPWIEIGVECATSGIEFVRAKMSMHDFAMALTGCGCVPASLAVGGLEYVGKQHQWERRSIHCPHGKNLSSEQLSRWLGENAPNADGWMPDGYLGGHTSVVHDRDGDGVTLNYIARRYVDIEPKETT